jgi:hypothetical protein
MAIESLLTDLMVQSITIAAVSSKDAYGKRTWGSPSTINQCRVQSGDHKVLDSLGQEKVANGRVYVPGAPTLTLNDKITLPDGSTPPILAISRLSDERGSHHSIIHYGSTSA